MLTAPYMLNYLVFFAAVLNTIYAFAIIASSIKYLDSRCLNDCPFFVVVQKRLSRVR